MVEVARCVARCFNCVEFVDVALFAIVQVKAVMLQKF